MKRSKGLLIATTIFLGLYFMPIELLPFRDPFFEALALVKSYAREHVLLCLLPRSMIATGKVVAHPLAGSHQVV